MKKSTRSRQRRKLRKAKWPLYSFAVLFATGIIASAYTVPNSASQIAAAAAAKSGTCEKTYQNCISQNAANSAVCDDQWKKCINAKCLRTESKYQFQQCSRDPDCLTSCTQWATSKTGLVSCCFGGPQHNNTCPQKVDKQCNPEGEDFSYPIFPGMEGYAEGDRIPKEYEPSKQQTLESEFLAPKPPLPNFLLNYPDNMWGDYGNSPQSGLNPDLDWYRQTPDISQIEKIANQPYELPPEYRPTSDDTVRLNQLLSGNQAQLPLSNENQPPSNNDTLASPISSQSTFVNPNSGQIETTPNTCHFRFWRWCLW